MRNVVIGMVIGVVVGVVIGATVIAPRLAPSASSSLKRKALASVIIARRKGKAAVMPDVARANGRSVDVAAAQDAAKKSIHLKMASAYPGNLPQLGAQAKRLEKKLWRVSEGRVNLEFYEPGTLVKTSEIFEAVSSGAIDAAFSSPELWSEKIPALRLFSAVPFGPSPEEYLAWIYFGGGRRLLEKIYNNRGIHGIVCGIVPARASGWFRKKINVVEDLKDLKIRFSGLGGKVMRKLGAKPVRIEGGKIFTAFETGKIDAAEFSMPAIDLRMGFYKMARHYYFPGWQQPAGLLELLINRKIWKKLPPMNKTQIEGVCGDNISYGLAEGGARQFAALKELSAKGVKIHRWPTEILDALRKAWTGVVSEEQKADKGFAIVWKSLSTFRNNYAIWKELEHM